MNYPLTRSDIVVHRFFDNPVEVYVKDVDKKPVNLTGFTLTATLVDPIAERVLLEVPVTIVDAVNGIARFTVGRLDAGNIPAGHYQYCITASQNGLTQTLYMDRGYRASGTVQVPKGPLPSDVPSITVPFDAFHQQDARFLSGSYPGAASVGNTSAMHTVAFYANAFSGVFEIQASLDAEPSVGDDGWGTVETLTFNGMSGIQDFTFIGAYNWIRFVVTPSGGDFSKIIFRN